MEPEHKMRKYPNFAKFCVSPRGSVGRVMKIEIGVREARVQNSLGTYKKIKEVPSEF